MTDVLAQPQEPTPQERLHKLVFRGGGTKGLEHIGTITELEKAGAWQDVREVWGSSAGGIVSVLAGIGMSAQEIQDEMSRFNFKDLMDKDTPFWSEALGIKEIDFLGITNVTDKLAMASRVLTSEGHGIYKGDAFADYAKLFISARTGNPNITFAELHKAATDPNDPLYDPRFKDIMLTGSKIGPPPPELRVFNWKDTPNMPIWKAVRITMSFPGAFKAVEHEGEIFVDGGLKDNLPMNPAMNFKSEDDGYHMRSTPKGGVMGVYMETTETIDYVMHGKKGKQHLADVGAIDFGKYLAKAPLANIEVLQEFKDSIVMPDTLKQPTLNFEMDEPTKQKLLTEGGRAAQEKLAKRTDWTRYQDYHDEQDKIHIMQQWQKRQALILAIKTSGDPLGTLAQEIKHIESKYKSFNITFDGVLDDYINKLQEIFQQRKVARDQAIAVAQERMKVTQKTIALSQAHESLHVVGEIIQEYDKQKKAHDVLVEHSEIIVGLNKIIQSIIERDNNPNIQSAFAVLEAKIQALDLHKHEDPETFQKTMQTATAQLGKDLGTLEINPEQKENFNRTLQLYGGYVNTHPNSTLPSLPRGEELSKYQAALQQRATRIEAEAEAKALKENLIQLEIDCYKSGMTLLHPDKGPEIVATKDKDCTTEKLKTEHGKVENEYTTAMKSGKTADIAVFFSPKHYKEIVLAKKTTFDAINKNTGFTVKFADLLQRNCNFLYQAFHFLACLNPLSTYKSVVLMWQVYKQLGVVQENLEKKANFYAHDETAQSYISAIETINEKLKDTHGSKSDKNKNFQALNKLLTNFEEHRKKVEQSETSSTPIAPTPQKPSPSPSS